MSTAYGKRRQELQSRLDAAKTGEERNRLGQFATPPELADDLLAYAKNLLPNELKISFLDPGFGTGAFYEALVNTVPEGQIERAEAFEIDPHYHMPSREFWGGTPLKLHGTDFTTTDAPQEESEKFNLIICNPPYVRHHHIANGDKHRLQEASERIIGERMSGLAGLYCHFLVLSHDWMQEGALAGWLIPSEFMDVNYGKSVKQYLLNQVTLLRIHRFDPVEVQFKDALVSSVVVWFRKAKPPLDHSVEFTFGGTLTQPKLFRVVSASVLPDEPKWTRFPLAEERDPDLGPTLGDFFVVKRGLATGGNRFFILPRGQIESLHLPLRFFRPVLPSPRFLKTDEVYADSAGNPILEPQLFLLDCRLPTDVLRDRYPSLWDYLETGRQTGVAEGYLCKHRYLWYAQEDRPPSPFICTYMGRGAKTRDLPFRFILNHSKATVTNSYLVLYPNDPLDHALISDQGLARRLWSALNETGREIMLAEGRIYGGGLHKIEPKELARVPARTIVPLLPASKLLLGRRQQELFSFPS